MWILVVITIATGAEMIVSLPFSDRISREGLITCQSLADDINTRKQDPFNTWRIECRLAKATNDPG